jgi:hypothetical protein
MRALKFILTGLLAVIALTAGFVVAAVAALVGIAIFFAGRLLGRSRFRVVVGPKTQRRSRPAESSDAIDVTATEVESTATPLPEPSREHDHIRA